MLQQGLVRSCDACCSWEQFLLPMMMNIVLWGFMCGLAFACHRRLHTPGLHDMATGDIALSEAEQEPEKESTSHTKGRKLR